MEERRPTIYLLSTPEEVARRAAEAVVEAAESSIAESGRFVMALSGGSTPKRMYEILANELAGDIDWDNVTLIFGDERCVPPHDPDSNYRMVHAALTGKLPIDESHLLRVRGEDGDNVRAASQYNSQLRSLLGERGSIDLVLLGMGPDGHTASLFSIDDDTSATVELNVREQLEGSVLPRLVVATAAPSSSPVTARVSLSFAAIRAAARVFALITGQDKAIRLKQAIAGARDLPIGRVVQERGGRIQFFIDAAAGTALGQ